jgi:PAS domain S-box-containing protein
MNTIRVQLAAALRKLATLQRRVELQPDTLVQGAIAELLGALEELREAEELLLAQREQVGAGLAALQAEREKYTQLFDAAPDPYLITDARLTILGANRAASELFNISQRFLTGKGLTIFISKDRGLFLSQAARLAVVGESTRWSFTIRPRARASLEVDARVVTHATEEGPELHWVLTPLGGKVR